MGDATWKIRFRSNGSEPKTETFPYVVVASWSVQQAFYPAGAGTGVVLRLRRCNSQFSLQGTRELSRDAGPCRRAGAISALEIASDLAMLGAARIVSTFRRQRYVVQKLG